MLFMLRGLGKGQEGVRCTRGQSVLILVDHHGCALSLFIVGGTSFKPHSLVLMLPAAGCILPPVGGPAPISSATLQRREVAQSWTNAAECSIASPALGRTLQTRDYWAHERPFEVGFLTAEASPGQSIGSLPHVLITGGIPERRG